MVAITAVLAGSALYAGEETAGETEKKQTCERSFFP